MPAPRSLLWPARLGAVVPLSILSVGFTRAAAAQNLASLVFAAPRVDGIRVRIEGKDIGKVPMTGWYVQASPGSHSVEVFEGDDRMYGTSETFVAGQSYTFRTAGTGRSRHGCNPGPGCGQPTLPPRPPDGPTGTVRVVNKGTWPVMASGANSVLTAWADVSGGRGIYLHGESPYVTKGDSTLVQLPHSDGGAPGLNGGGSHTVANTRSEPAPVYVQGADAPSGPCAGNNYRLLISDGAPTVVLSSYTGPVLVPAQKSTICDILGCPTGGSSSGGLRVVTGTITETAPTGIASWSCR